jgi:hypothetical protein
MGDTGQEYRIKISRFHQSQILFFLIFIVVVVPFKDTI